MKEIVGKDAPILREIAQDIPVKDITSAKIQTMLTEMKVALDSQEDGVAIAAPQIGISLRIFLVSGKIFEEDFVKNRTERLAEEQKSNLENLKKTDLKKEKIIKHLVFINPKILKLSKEQEWVPEGCLSVRWLYGQTHRSTKVIIEALDETGKKFTRGASGLLAQIFQHETDHLNGILFIDHAKDIKEDLPAGRKT